MRLGEPIACRRPWEVCAHDIIAGIGAGATDRDADSLGNAVRDAIEGTILALPASGRRREDCPGGDHRASAHSRQAAATVSSRIECGCSTPVLRSVT